MLNNPDGTPSKELRVANNLSRALTYVLIIVTIVVGAQLFVGSALGSSPVYVVVSRSMVPTLEVGDLVIAQSVPFSSIHVGQVIIYERPTDLGTCPNPEQLTIVHRVVNETSSGLITQGDDRATNPQPDPWSPIPPECVKGVVVLAIPYLGLVSMLIPSPWNYALVGLILLFVFLSELRPAGRKGGEEEGTAGGKAPVASESVETQRETQSPSPGISPQ